MAIKANINAPQKIEVKFKGGKDGENGATFYPHVNDNGDLYWTNDKKLPNPKPVNIQGKDYILTKKDKTEIANNVLGMIDNGTNLAFETSSIDVAISVCGDGIITVDYGDGASESVSVEGGHTFKHRYSGELTTHTVTINGTEHVTELDMHGCGIESITFGKLDMLNKLVIYDNNISKMDISGMPNLQYLHIFNNPICNSDEALTALFNQLPDRNNKAFGSIIMYPFYPLGVFVYKNGNTLTKYPSGKAYTATEGEYYRDMNAETVTWYKYEDGAFIEQVEQNALINRRIKMEDITLPLGWLFGSAIQYNKTEYAKCGYHFKQNHIQDYWETAERGEGQTIGLYDHIAGKIPGFSELNIKAFEALDGTSLPIAGHVNDQIHGDFLLSLIANRGNLVYGIAPDSCQYLVDSYESGTDEYDQNSKVNFQKCAERLTANSDIITASAFYPASATYLPAKSYFHSFATVNPLFASISNDGDGLEWTEEERILMDTDAYFGENVFLVGSINEDDTFSPFSNSSYPTSANSKTSFTHEDIFAQYGSNIMAVTNAFGGMIYSACGTSCSSPICAAIVALMKNVYIKLYGEKKPYGKNSDFMRFVKIHSNPIYHVMNRAVGNGKPDLMYFNPLLANGTTVNVENVEIAEVNAIHGRGVDISPIVTPSNADNLAVTYDYDMSKFAIMGSVLHPLIEQADTISITAYSNMNEDKVATFNVNVPTTSTKTYETYKKRISLEDAAMPNSTKFTLQARINFPNIDSAKEENIFTFEHDDILVYLRNSFGKTMPTQKMRIMAEESVSNTDKTNLVMDDRLIGGTRMENLEGEVCVITLAVDDKNYSFYINGNLLRSGTLVTDVPLCGLTVNESYLPNGSAEDIRIYEGLLSHEEVIQNTIALLNGNERYSDVEKALDEIIAIKNSLIGGDGV